MIWALLAIGVVGAALAAARRTPPPRIVGDDDRWVATGDALVLDHGRGDEVAIGEEATIVEAGADAATCSIFAATRARRGDRQLARSVWVWVDRRRAGEICVLERVDGDATANEHGGERFVGRLAGARGVIAFEPETLLEARVVRVLDEAIALRVTAVDRPATSRPLRARGSTVRLDRCLHLRADGRSEDRLRP